MNTYQSEKYGCLTNITHLETDKNGAIKSCTFHGKNHFRTTIGDLVPRFRTSSFSAHENPSMSFFENGQIKSIDLETATTITTPLGSFTTERVCFYESGQIHRFFPLSGKTSEHWTENNTDEHAETLAFDLPVGSFSARIVNVCFYESGALKSLTLCSKETIEITSPDGSVKVRFGFSLYENGNLKSFEPAIPEPIVTPVGIIIAYAPNVHDANEDVHSVNYTPEGNIHSLITAHSGLMISSADSEIFLQPLMKPSFIDPAILQPEPMNLVFSADHLDIIQDDLTSVDLIRSTVRPILVREPGVQSCCNHSVYSDCSTCSGCHGCNHTAKV